MKAPVHNTLIVAAGSSHGDDIAAWKVADFLQVSFHNSLHVRKASVPLDLIDWLDEIDDLHIIDACEAGGEIGDLLRFDWPSKQLTTLRAAGTHDFDLTAVLELADKLNRLPEDITIWGIVGKNFEPQGEISAAVESQLPSIVETIGKEVRDARIFIGSVAAEPG